MVQLDYPWLNSNLLVVQHLGQVNSRQAGFPKFEIFLTRSVPYDSHLVTFLRIHMDAMDELGPDRLNAEVVDGDFGVNLGDVGSIQGIDRRTLPSGIAPHLPRISGSPEPDEPKELQRRPVSTTAAWDASSAYAHHQVNNDISSAGHCHPMTGILADDGRSVPGQNRR